VAEFSIVVGGGRGDEEGYALASSCAGQWRTSA
jgi:hypothetical protein